MPSKQARLGLVDEIPLLEAVENINLDSEIATQDVQQRRGQLGADFWRAELKWYWRSR